MQIPSKPVVQTCNDYEILMCTSKGEQVKFQVSFYSVYMLISEVKLLLGGTILKILLLTQIDFSKVILEHTTVQVMWMVPAWGLTFQLPQLANFNHQNCKLRCIYQVLKFPNQSPNSVTVEFTLF